MTAGPTAFLRDADETEAFAKAFGILCKGGERLALKGEMGAGKTTFVRGLAAGLGIESHEISSPTFTLIHVHDGQGDEALLQQGWVGTIRGRLRTLKEVQRD